MMTCLKRLQTREYILAKSCNWQDLAGFARWSFKQRSSKCDFQDQSKYYKIKFQVLRSFQILLNRPSRIEELSRIGFQQITVTFTLQKRKTHRFCHRFFYKILRNLSRFKICLSFRFVPKISRNPMRRKMIKNFERYAFDKTAYVV